AIAAEPDERTRFPLAQNPYRYQVAPVPVSVTFNGCWTDATAPSNVSFRCPPAATVPDHTGSPLAVMLTVAGPPLGASSTTESRIQTEVQTFDVVAFPEAITSPPAGMVNWRPSSAMAFPEETNDGTRAAPVSTLALPFAMWSCEAFEPDAM